MERLAVMKSFNRGLPPSPYTSFRPHPKTATPLTLRDASFSAYLPPADDLAYALKKEVPAAMADDTEISIFDAQKYFNESSTTITTEHQQHKESKRVAPVGPEHCESQPVTRASSSVDGYGRNYQVQSFHATPTASSEASWNSQTGLLRNPPGAIGVNMGTVAATEKSRNASGRKWFFRRKCPCSGKKAVEIKQKNVSEPRSPIGDSKKVTDKSNGNTNNPQKVVKKSVKSLDSGREWVLTDRHDHDHDHDLIPRRPKFPSSESHFIPDRSTTAQLAHRVLASGHGFSFPILSQPPPVKMVLTSVRNPMEDPPRDSLEIFRPSDDCITRKSADSIPPPRIFAPNPPDRRSFTFSASPKSRAAAIDDDVASDASSDLFEIESFTTQTTTTTTATNYPMYHRRDSLDEASRRFGYCTRRSLDECATPSVAPMEGYEPSEASIDWSVTTAEGFDRGSVTNFSVSASDIIDVTLMRQELQRLGNRCGFEENGSGGGGRRRGNGMLTSCRCEKAVSVGPGPTPVKEGHGQGQGGTYRHVSSRDKDRIGGGGGGVGKSKPPLARSHSARLSLTFPT